MTGDSDYLLRVVAKDLQAYESFIRKKIHRVPSVASIDSSFAFGIVKQARAFTMPK